MKINELRKKVSNSGGLGVTLLLLLSFRLKPA